METACRARTGPSNAVAVAGGLGLEDPLHQRTVPIISAGGRSPTLLNTRMTMTLAAENDDDLN